MKGLPTHTSLPFCTLSAPQYSPKVQVFEFLKAADLCGQFFNLVIKKVKHFQVLQLCYIWRHSYRDKMQDVNQGASLPARNTSNTFCFSFRWSSYSNVTLEFICSFHSFLGSQVELHHQVTAELFLLVQSDQNICHGLYQMNSKGGGRKDKGSLHHKLTINDYYKMHTLLSVLYLINATVFFLLVLLSLH